MNKAFVDFSNTIADAVEHGARSVVQVSSRRRPAAGVVFAPELILAPARALADDSATVRLPGGDTFEGEVLGHVAAMGLGVLRVPGLSAPVPQVAPEPRVGSLAVAIGRTWSGAPMAAVTTVAVVGGPLRTGRARHIDRVIRIAQSPHGAFHGGALVDGTGAVLGVMTASEIRGTTVVIPATLAWQAAQQVAEHGGSRQGYLGVSTLPVELPERQSESQAEKHGLLVTAVAAGSPADAAGLLIGDVLLSFAGSPIHDPESLLTLLRRDQLGKAVTLTVVRGVERQEMNVTIGERPTPRG